MGINARLDGAVALLTWNRKRQGPRMTLMSFAALHPLTRAASNAARIDAGAKLAVAPNACLPAPARNAGNAGRGGPECPFRRIGAQCDGYSFTVGLRNRSRETISSVFVGWVFIPEGQSGCPTSYPTRYQQTVTLRPGDTTVLNIDTRFDGPSGPFRYCVALTGVDIVP